MSTFRWVDLKAHELSSLAAKDAIVVVPVGSMEQHGPHLPVQVDALLATEVSMRAVRIVSQKEPAVVAPTVWCGLAEHHMDFGGTITLDFDTFRATLRCLCSSMVRHGFSKIMLLNGHGGNVAALSVIAQELAREFEAPIATVTYWQLTKVTASFAEILDAQKSVRHACEAETSMLLAIAPELVDRDAMRDVEGGDASVLDANGAYRYRSFAELSASGVIGFPANADSEKGERLLEAAASALADTLMSDDTW